MGLKFMVFSQRAKKTARKNGIDLSGLHLSSFQYIDTLDDYRKLFNYILSLFPAIRLLISKMYENPIRVILGSISSRLILERRNPPNG